MKLYIKQRVFSFGQRFDICDENGKPLYSCQGEVFTFGRKLHLYDLDNNEVAYIRQQLFRWFPHYDVYIGGELATTLVRKFSFFKHNYFFEKLPYQIDGDFFAHEYRVYDNTGSTLMTVEKEWFTWGDTYELNIEDESQLLLMLASAIVIDCVCHEGKH